MNPTASPPEPAEALRTSTLLAVAGLLAAQVSAMREIRLSGAPDRARLGPLFNP